MEDCIEEVILTSVAVNVCVYYSVVNFFGGGGILILKQKYDSNEKGKELPAVSFLPSPVPFLK